MLELVNRFVRFTTDFNMSKGLEIEYSWAWLKTKRKKRKLEILQWDWEVYFWDLYMLYRSESWYLRCTDEIKFYVASMMLTINDFNKYPGTSLCLERNSYAEEEYYFSLVYSTNTN